MITENKELMRQARIALQGKWELAVPAWLIYFLMSGAIPSLPLLPAFKSAVSLVLGGPLAFGMARFSLALARHQTPRLEEIFDGFRQFTRTLVAHLLMVAFILLWSLLLVVPGIIAAISYSQTFYILNDDPSITAEDALKKSKALMDGYKWKYFYLGLRFLGWALLCLLTLGIGFLWLAPYMQVSFAKFYEDVKENAKRS